MVEVRMTTMTMFMYYVFCTVVLESLLWSREGQRELGEGGRAEGGLERKNDHLLTQSEMLSALIARRCENVPARRQ